MTHGHGQRSAPMLDGVQHVSTRISGTLSPRPYPIVPDQSLPLFPSLPNLPRSLCPGVPLATPPDPESQPQSHSIATSHIGLGLLRAQPLPIAFDRSHSHDRSGSQSIAVAVAIDRRSQVIPSLYHVLLGSTCSLPLFVSFGLQ